MTDYVNELRLMAEDIYSGVGSVPEVKTLSSAADEIEKLRLGLENCRLLAARHRKEDWALLILGFCAEAGVVGSIMR